MLHIDGNKKAACSAGVAGQCSREAAHGLLAWNTSGGAGITKRPALVEHGVGALTTTLTSHLKDIIAHSLGSDAYRATHEELAG